MDNQNAESGNQTKLLRLPQVLAIFPVSRSRWYAGVKSGEFPQAVKLSTNIVAWRESDIMALITRLDNCA